MKKNVRKSDLIMLIFLIVIFAGIIFMNTRLINSMMLSQVEQRALNRLEIIRNDYEDAYLEEEKLLLELSHEVDKELYTSGSGSALDDFIKERNDKMKIQTNGLVFRIYAAGKAWISLPDYELPDGFRYSEQAWYLGAIARKGKTYLTDPYPDGITGEYCYTLSVALEDGETVVAIDVLLENSEEYIRRMVGGEESKAIIVTTEGLIVGYNDPGCAGKSLTVALPEYASAMEKIKKTSRSEGYIKTTIDGEDITVTYSSMQNGWYMLVFMRDSDLYGDAGTYRIINIVVNVLLLLLLIVTMIAGARNRIKAQDALRSREAFVSNIVNNLHEPLGKILRLSDMERFNNSNDIKADMADIKASGLTLKELMDNLRSYSTIVSDTPVTIEVGRKKHRALTSTIRRIRNVIIILLILISGISMFFYVRNRSNVVRETIQSDMDHYAQDFIYWEVTQSVVLEMFVNVISTQPEVLNNYDQAVEWLNLMAQKYPIFSACYVVNPEAEHPIIMSTGWDGDGFDFTEREWYKEALEEYPYQCISEPYYEATNGTYCITLSQAIYDENQKFLGVFGLDIYLDQLTWIFESEVYDKEYVFLVDCYGNILNHPNSDYRMTKTNQVKIEDTPYADIYAASLEGKNDEIRTIRDYNGKTSLCLCNTIEGSGFSIVMVGNWWIWYREILLYCGMYVVFIGACIITIILLLNRVIRSQADMNHELAITAERAMAAGQAKSDFLAQMSHEIRTPINAVIGMDEMILRENNDPDIREYAENIKSASQTLLTLINGILDFSKIESGKMEILQVRYETLDMIDNLVNMVSARTEKKGLNLILDIDPKLPRTLFGDDVRIRQIITNLLTNAVKYTHEGDVTLSIRGEEGEGDDYTLRVAVKDTGIGIKPEDIDKLCVSFQRLEEEKNRNIEGTGLGMSIVQGLLEMMGSKLEVESEYGKGSTFSFSMAQKVIDREEIGEYSILRSKEKEAAVVRKTLLMPDAKILFVDDNEMNLRVARGLMKRYGVVPDLCDSGRKSLDLIRNTRYDIILMDHMMPGMDGVDALKAIRDQNLTPKDVPIVALTANAIAGAREQYLEYGFADYLSKPIDVNQLEDMLIKYIPSEKLHFKEDEPEAPAADTAKAADTTKASDTPAEAPAPEAEATGEASSSGFVDQLAMAGFNIEKAREFTIGDDEFYLELLETFVRNLDEKYEGIKKSYDAEDWQNYQILVHGLKSSARTIGDDTLADLAYAQELAAKALDVAKIHDGVEELLSTYKESVAIVAGAIKE